MTGTAPTALAGREDRYNGYVLSKPPGGSWGWKVAPEKARWMSIRDVMLALPGCKLNVQHRTWQMQAAEAAICIFEENTPMMSKRKVTTYRSDQTLPIEPAQALFLPLFLGKLWWIWHNVVGRKWTASKRRPVPLCNAVKMLQPEKPKTLMPEAYCTKAVDDFNTLWLLTKTTGNDSCIMLYIYIYIYISIISRSPLYSATGSAGSTLIAPRCESHAIQWVHHR